MKIGTDSLDTEEVNAVDVIIQRSLMLGAGEVTELTRIRNTSGTWFVGLGFKVPVIKNRVGLRITPGLAYTKLIYDSVDVAKVFPDLPEGEDYNFQKHRLTYLQVPIGVYVNFTTDAKGRPQIFAEAGGYVGYRTNGVLRYAINSTQDQEIRTKITNIPDMEPWQYGIYGRLGYKRFALVFQYRMTRLFKSVKRDEQGQVTTIPNPIFPQLEIGLSLLL